MARVVLEPIPRELIPHQEQYDALVEDLTAEGFDVELERPMEERGLPSPHEVEALFELVVHISEVIDAAGAVAGVTGFIRSRLRGPARLGPHTGEPRKFRLLYVEDGVEREKIIESESDAG